MRRDESEGLLLHLVNQRAAIYDLLDGADEKFAAPYHARLTANIELEAKLFNQIGGRSMTVNNALVIAPEYLALRAALLKALAPPEFQGGPASRVSRPPRGRGDDARE